MKTVYLVRHAEAEDRKASKIDFERTLVKEGQKNAKKMGKKLKKRGIHLDLILSSPAARSLETALIFAKEVDYPPERVHFEPDLYMATRPHFLRILKKTKDAYQTILVVGHEPSLSELASFFVKDFATILPKGGIIRIDFHETHWKELKAGQGALTFLSFPEESEHPQLKDTQKVFKQKKELESQIFQKMQQMIFELKGTALKNKQNTYLKKVSKTLAKKLFESSS